MKSYRSDTGLHCCLAELYLRWKAGTDAQARVLFHRVLTLEPRSPVALLGLGNVHLMRALACKSGYKHATMHAYAIAADTSFKNAQRVDVEQCSASADSTASLRSLMSTDGQPSVASFVPPPVDVLDSGWQESVSARVHADGVSALELDPLSTTAHAATVLPDAILSTGKTFSRYRVFTWCCNCCGF